MFVIGVVFGSVDVGRAVLKLFVPVHAVDAATRAVMRPSQYVLLTRLFAVVGATLHNGAKPEKVFCPVNVCVPPRVTNPVKEGIAD